MVTGEGGALYIINKSNMNVPYMDMRCPFATSLVCSPKNKGGGGFMTIFIGGQPMTKC